MMGGIEHIPFTTGRLLNLDISGRKDMHGES